ncbi:MAG: hypothetical protein ACP5VR_00040 [Acidimicrobiales bacterium]
MSKASVQGTGSARLARRWLMAFGRFWWDFLVGDTPELLVGALVALGVVAFLVRACSLNAVAVGALPAMAALALGLSAWRSARARHRR